MLEKRSSRRIWLSLLLLAVMLAPVTAVAAPLPPEQGSLPFVAGEVLLKVQPGVSASEIARGIGATVARSIGDGSIQVLQVREGAVPAAVQALNAQSGVAFAEPNWLRQLHIAPDDGGYALKWDLHNDGSLYDSGDAATADADMDWQEAYDLLGSGFGGSAVVAVIDTGIDLNHPDLAVKITTNGYDFLADDSDPTDTYGHGTHVAGIALAKTGNGSASADADTAGVGYSPNILVMPLRVCDQNGCPTSAIVDAVQYAADNGAHVINLSLGGRFASSSEQLAINYAWDKGLVIVASSGNDGTGKVSYPAAFVNVIAVGSTNWHDQLAPYSNKGGDLDVVAPGGDMSSYHDPGGIYSTMPTYAVYLTTAYGYDTGYDQLQGTSMAAPQVSGLAGLLFALDVPDSNGDGKTNDEIRALIESTTDDLGKSGWDREYGWGRINVFSAVQAVVGGGGDARPSVTITSPSDGSTVVGTVIVTVDAADDNGVTQVEFFVDGVSIGVDTDDSDGWSSVPWDTTGTNDGEHTLSATATDTTGQMGSDTINVIVDNIPSAGVTVGAIAPNSMTAGTTTDVTIEGSAFVDGATVTFENGAGPSPAASDVVVVDGNKIEASVYVKSGGRRTSRVWDVRVTNADGSTGVLEGGFTVTR